ncbi:MAG: tyrosine-type recombinase/integrase [Leptolyngbya sp. SIO4C5]|nr:tyrosine-type recombinase/integrase [Leptolyngbya sp. SIO4C5]
MSNLVPLTSRSGAAIAIASTNQQLIDLWLHEKSENTRAAYQRDAGHFLAFIEGKPLDRVTLNDMQAFKDGLLNQRYKASTVKRRLAAAKSLLKYGFRIGLLPVDVGAAISLPKLKNELAQRILPESQMLEMIHTFKGSVRDRVMLRVLYATGGRASEIAGLTWEDCQSTDDGIGKLTLFGKGDKTRHVLVSVETWELLQGLRGNAVDSDPVFRSRKGKHLQRSQIWRVVKRAAEQAGIDKPVSPHWFRHAHASHALKRGTPINLVQATLGHASVATTGRYTHACPEDSSGLHLPI